jgi:hypothetical protein
MQDLEDDYALEDADLNLRKRTREVEVQVWNI